MENDTEKLRRLAEACIVADREYNEFAKELVDKIEKSRKELVDKIEKSREAQDESQGLS
jgi:hypothetical protein